MNILNSFIVTIFLFVLPLFYLIWSIINIVFKLYFPNSGYIGVITILPSRMNTFFSIWCFSVLFWIYYNEYTDSFDSKYYWYDCFWILPLISCGILSIIKKVRQSFNTFILYSLIFFVSIFIRSRFNY